MMVAATGWAQSLADLVRADRERAKPRATRVFTNDNLNDPASEHLTRKDPASPPATSPAAHVTASLAAKAEPLAPQPLTPTPKAAPMTPEEKELEHMRTILRGICSDPRTAEGRTLSDTDKAVMAAGIKPLRARVEEFERNRKKYKDALATLDQDFEAKVLKAVNSEKPLTDVDLQRVKSLRQERDARRATLIRQAEGEEQAFRAWQEEVEAVGEECSAAANTVPD